MTGPSLDGGANERTTVDVVCTGMVFLDLIFEGLDELPTPGRERWAHELHESPGGAGTTAIGLARLGLRSAVVAPLGRDIAGRTVRELLEREGVVCATPESERTSVTVVLPLDGDRAMVTYEPPARIDSGTIARLEPRAAVANADELEAVPDGVAAYATVGDAEATVLAQRLPDGLGRARALLLNQQEAQRITGTSVPEAAALSLAEQVETVVVTCGASGAVAASGGELVTASAPMVETRDTTGAGDLLVAAYVHGDLKGLPLAERLQRAVVYAALSVQKATGAMSAATLDELEHALDELDPVSQSASAKEAP
jgi:sugar/nucleoside kinase (ribokinase family)